MRGSEITQTMSKILDTIRRAVGMPEKAPRQSSTPVYNVHPTPLAAVGREGAMQLSAVYACVNVLSDSVAKLPLEPYRYDITTDSRVKAVSGRFADVYNVLCYEPSKGVTRYDQLKSLVIDYLTTGNGYIHVRRRDDRGIASELVRWSPYDVVVVTEDDRHTIKQYYNTRLDIVAEVSDVIHVRNFPGDDALGVSTLTYARRTLGISEASERQAESVLSRGGTNLGILVSKSPTLTKQQRDEIHKEWADNFAPRYVQDGSNVAVLSSDLSYQNVSISPEDAQLLQTRQFNVPEICRFFNVPPTMIHDLSKSSYSTVEASHLAFLTDTLSPHLTKIELEYRVKVFPSQLRRKMMVEFDTSELSRGDNASQANLYHTLATIGAMTPNEVRAKYNLSPINGGDETYIQSNMTTLSSIIGAKDNQGTEGVGNDKNKQVTDTDDEQD